MLRGSNSGQGVAWTSPSTLFSIVCGVSLVFFMVYWPSDTESGAIMTIRKAGPAPTAVAEQQQRQQQPTSGSGADSAAVSPRTAQRQQQYLLDTIREWKDWGWTVTVGDARGAGVQEQPMPAAVKVRVDVFAADGNADATACALALQPALEKLHPIITVNTRSVKDHGVYKTCTIAVDGMKQCARDGQQWVDCSGGSSEGAFMRALCAGYEAKAGKAAAVCADAAAAPSL